MSTPTPSGQDSVQGLSEQQKKHIASIVHTDCTLIDGATFYTAAELAIKATLAALASSVSKPEAQEPVRGEHFVRAWLNRDSLPGTMMIGPEGKFGPVPASTSCWVTTSERERDRMVAKGEPMIEVWLAPPTGSAEGAKPAGCTGDESCCPQNEGYGCCGAEGAVQQASGQAEGAAWGQSTCGRCHGTGVVDDGEIDCYEDGTPYLNGPVNCVKDCPACKGRLATPTSPTPEAKPAGQGEAQVWKVIDELREAAREALANDPANGIFPDRDHAATLNEWADRLETSHAAFYEDAYNQCAEAIRPLVDAGELPGSVVESLQLLVDGRATPLPAQVQPAALLTIEQQRELCDLLLNSEPATREEIEAVEISDEEFAPMVARLHAKMAELRVQPDEQVGGIKVGRLPTLTQDEYPGLGAWWVQLRIGAEADEVLARVYGNSPEQAVQRAHALAATPLPAQVQPDLPEEGTEYFSAKTVQAMIEKALATQRKHFGWVQPAEQVGEPAVAWQVRINGAWVGCSAFEYRGFTDEGQETRRLGVLATPAQPKPVSAEATEAQIDSIISSVMNGVWREYDHDDARRIVRAALSHPVPGKDRV